jgi:hypothetical protein
MAAFRYLNPGPIPRHFRGYIWVRFRSNPQVCSAHFLGLCQRTMCFRSSFTLPSSYMGELPNSHGRTLTDKSYVMPGILSGTWYFKKMKEQLNLVNNVPDPLREM